MMRTPAYALLAALALLPARAAAEEFDNLCAWALADRGVERMTDCAVNWKDPETGKTYCFSNEQTRMLFLQEPEETIQKAEETFHRLRKKQ